MLLPLIGPRLHGWLDDLVALLYVAGALILGLHGLALTVALGGAAVHFTLTRLTNYPQGTLKLIPFRVHAFIELSEGIAVLAATWLLVHDAAALERGFLTVMGLTQFGAFALSDYSWPPPLSPR